MTEPTEAERRAENRRTEDLALTTLAQQRQADLAAQHQRELDAAVRQGRREAELKQEAENTRKHFAIINGSIADTAKALQALTGEVHDIKEEQIRRDAVNAALIESAAGTGAKKFNRYQVWGIVLMALMTLGSLMVAIVQTIVAG